MDSKISKYASIMEELNPTDIKKKILYKYEFMFKEVKRIKQGRGYWGRLRVHERNMIIQKMTKEAQEFMYWRTLEKHFTKKQIKCMKKHGLDKVKKIFNLESITGVVYEPIQSL